MGVVYKDSCHVRPSTHYRCGQGGSHDHPLFYGGTVAFRIIRLRFSRNIIRMLQWYVRSQSVNGMSIRIMVSRLWLTDSHFEDMNERSLHNTEHSNLCG